MRAGPCNAPGITCASPSRTSIRVPSAASAAAISSVSRARSGRWITDGPSASAARTSARFVTDFDGGTRTRARTGRPAYGAGQTAGDGAGAVSW